MLWTVQIEDEAGQPRKILPNGFWLSDARVLYDGEFKTLCYLDPYGDTTFNAYMFDDLITDLIYLEKKLSANATQIDEIILLAHECQEDVHTYLKFYGE